MRIWSFITSITGISLIVVIEILAVIISYKIWKWHNAGISLSNKKLWCSIFCGVLTFVTVAFFLSDDNRPSTVSVIPLEELNEVDISSVTQQFENFDDSPFECVVREERTDSRSSPMKEYIGLSYYIMNDDNQIENSLTVFIRRYNTHELAVAALYKPTEKYWHRNEQIKLSNGIDIIKGLSWRTRVYTLFQAQERRVQYTYFVIGDYYFRLDESARDVKNIGNATNEGIRLLCEIIKGE